MTDLDLAGAAARVGRSYSWLQRNWRTLTHGASGQPFPAPYIGAELGGRPRWTAAAIDAWKAGAPTPAGVETPGDLAQRGAPANDPTPRRPQGLAQTLIAAAGGS